MEIADGTLRAATHIGTLRVLCRDDGGTWRSLSQEGAWLCPGIASTLLSVRACKAAGWRAPDFEAMRVYDGAGRAYPIGDDGVSYSLDLHTVPDAVASACVAAAVDFDRRPAASADAGTEEPVGGLHASADVEAMLDAAVGDANPLEQALASMVRGRRRIPVTRKSARRVASELHTAFGHVTEETLRGIIESSDDYDAREKRHIRAALKHIDCDACRRANMQRKPAPTANLKAGAVTGFVTSDVKGGGATLPKCPLGPFKNAEYAVGFHAEKEDFVGVYYVSRKSSVIDALAKFQADMRALNPQYTVVELRTDGALEYASIAAQEYYTREKIRHSVSPPYTPNTTRIEPLWRTLDRIARASMADSGLPESWWPYAFQYAADVRNCMRRGSGKSGHENLTGNAPRVSTFRPLGCRAYVRKSDREVRAAGSAALGPRGWLGINLGLKRGGGPGGAVTSLKPATPMSTNVLVW